MAAEVEDGTSAPRRRVFAQYLNPEILRLYGASRRFTDRGLLERALLLTRYATLVTERDVILPQSYLYEVGYIDTFLHAVAPLRQVGLLSIASETPDPGAYLPRKRREYRGEFPLFDAYTAKPADELVETLEWAPRVRRSTAADITEDWLEELERGDLWEDFLRRTGKRGVNRLPSLIESAIATVPERLQGQAFILRFALPLLPITLDTGTVTEMDLLISRGYLRSYLDEFQALIISETPLGDLSCGLPNRARGGRLQSVSYRRMASFFERLGVRDVIERRLTWPTLLALRTEPVFQWAVGWLVDEREPRLPFEVATMLRSRYRMASRSASRLLPTILDRLWGLYEAVQPTLAGAADPELLVPRSRRRVRRPRGAATLLIQPPLWTPLPAASRNDVFLVCGRDRAANEGMKAMLRAASITPIEWEEAVSWTGSGSPYVLEVLDAAFARVQAVLILFTPDEEVRLDRNYVRDDDPDYERRQGRQARPNVLVEAGMALALHPDRTVIVEFQPLRPLTDLQGLHTLRFDGTASARKAVIDRLATAGCRPRGSAYLEVGFADHD